MATKKATTKTSTAVAVKKPASTAIANIQDLLRKQAEANAARVAPATGKSIRIGQDKTFTLPDGTKTREPLQLVVVDFVSRNEFYVGAYNKDDISPPACFAIGPDPTTLVPSNNSPEKQNDVCKGCPQNEFGSSPTGAGKACKNQRYLAVLPPDADDETDIWLLKVSPTGIKSFDGFVAGASRMQMAPVQMVVTVGFSDAVQYPSLEFSDPQPNENLAVHFARQDEAREMLMAEPDVSSYSAEPKAKAKPASRKPMPRAVKR